MEQELSMQDQGNKRSVNSNDDMKGSYLGTEFNQDDIEKELKTLGASFEILNYEIPKLLKKNNLSFDVIN